MNTLNRDLVVVTTMTCVICFNNRAYNIKLSTEESDQVFKNCVNYLDISLNIESPKPETQLTFCRDCYNQEFYITQCTKKLTAIQKEISDSRFAFSQDVLLRRKRCKKDCKTNTNNHPSTQNTIELQLNISSTTTDIKNEIGDQLTPQTIITAKELSVPNTEKDNNGANESVIEGSENHKGCCNFKDEEFDMVPANLTNTKAGEIDRTEDEKHQLQSKPPCPLSSSSSECPTEILLQEAIQESFGDTRGVEINVKNEIQSELVSQDDTLLEYQRYRNLNFVHGKSSHENSPSKHKETNKTVGNEIDGFDEMSVRVAISSFQSLNLIKTITLPIIRLERLQVDKNHPKDKTSCPKRSEREFKKDFGKAQTKTKPEEVSKDIEKKAFKCLICQKSFLLLSDLKYHGVIHTEKKTYKCSFCKKVFRRKRELANHKQFHSNEAQGGLKCALCGKMCKNTIYLKFHMVSHTGERHFKCSTCEESFQFLSNLEEHKRIHSIEKHQYKFAVCKKTYRKKRPLTMSFWLM